MKYTAPDETILESSPTEPIVYKCLSPLSWSDGTYESYETSSDSNNNLVQIKVIRVVESGFVTITITEQTKEEIINYFQNINQTNAS